MIPENQDGLVLPSSASADVDRIVLLGQRRTETFFNGVPP